MLLLEELSSGAQVAGLTAGGLATVLAVSWHGLDAVEVTYKSGDGGCQIVCVSNPDGRVST